MKCNNSKSIKKNLDLGCHTHFASLLLESTTARLLRAGSEKNIYTGAGQNNVNTTDTIVLYFFINMVFFHLLPSIQPQSFLEWTCTRFEQSLAEYHASWSLFSSCFRGTGGGTQFLTLVFKNNHSGSMIFKSSDWASHERCWNLPSCSSNHDSSSSYVNGGTVFFLETESLFVNNIWIKGCIWLPNLSMYSLAVIQPWKIIMKPTEYCTMILLPKPS
jgi:hypothetical protein